jgi:hypothetical protein
MNCIFHTRKCRPCEYTSIKQLRDNDVVEFIHKICSMCIKDRYSRAKLLAIRRRYVVVNTL